MDKQKLKPEQIYKISFLCFYIIPIITISFKLIYGLYHETIIEIWFVILLLVVTAIIFFLPKLTKLQKERLIYLLVSAIVVFFALGALGYEAKYIIVDFAGMDLLFRIPYIIMFTLLIIQIVCIVIFNYNKDKTKDNEIVVNININKGLFLLMGIMVFLGYLISIVIKLFTEAESNYIEFELSILLGYILFYLGLILLMRFQFKQDLKTSLINSLFFVPFLSIGLALGIMFFNESFMFFKLTTLIIGIINLSLYIINLSTLRNKST